MAVTRHRLIALWTAVWLAFVLLAWLARRGATDRFDQAIGQRLDALLIPRLETAGASLTRIGLAEVTLGLATALALVAILLRRYRLAMAISLVWLSVPIELACKWLLYLLPLEPLSIDALVHGGLVASPDTGLQGISRAPGTYPSGHVARTTFLVGLLVWQLLDGRRSRAARLLAAPIVVAAVAFLLAVGATRRLDDHTPTDVVGGYLLALALLMPARLLLRGSR